MKLDMKDKDVNKTATQIMEGKIPVFEVGAEGGDVDDDREDVLALIDVAMDEMNKDMKVMNDNLRSIEVGIQELAKASPDAKASAKVAKLLDMANESRAHHIRSAKSFMLALNYFRNME